MIQRIKELRQRQETIAEEARERLNQINDNTDEARAAELEAAHDTAMAEYDKLEKQIKREERQLEIERNAEERRARNRPTGDDIETRGAGGDEPSPEYRHVFARVICGTEISDLTAEERNVLRTGAAKFENRAQTGGSNAAGGYTVPTELHGEIVQVMKAWGPMYDEEVATVMNTAGGNPIQVPTVDDTDNEADPHKEAEALKDDGSGDVEFGQKLLNAYVYNTPFVRWSFELNSDGIVNMESFLGFLIGERLGRIANRQLTVGTGTNAPNGILTASSQGLIAAAAASLKFDEIMELEHSVDPAYRTSPKVRYMFNDNTLLAIRKLKDGDGNYLWQKGDVQAGIPANFNGRKYSINQAMPDIAAGAKPMLFGDFSRYFVRKVGAPVVGVMRERFWPDMGIAGLIRFDGELGDANAVKHLKMKAG